MNKRVKISLKALRPLVKGEKGMPVKMALAGNVQKILNDWIAKGHQIGDELTFEIVKDEIVEGFKIKSSE